ncbi:hypothetical protein SK128_003314, partial [Halocaridina rubra]
MAENGGQPMFSEKERNKHKKQQLLNSSLGALLSGIGDVVRSSSSTQETKTTGDDKEREIKRAEVAGNSGLNTETSAMELEDWTETRQFDYEEDNEYLACEREKLDEKYGKGIIDVKYSGQGTLSYYCKLCSTTMNGKVPVECHCSGLKHLK